MRGSAAPETRTITVDFTGARTSFMSPEKESMIGGRRVYPGGSIQPSMRNWGGGGAGVVQFRALESL